MSDDTETRRTKDSQARTPEQQKVLTRIRRYLGDASFSEDMWGWAVVETPGGRFLGKVDREYIAEHASPTGEPWSELLRVDLHPFFVLPTPEVITLRYDVEHHSRSPITREIETKREQRVGAGLGQGAYPPGNMKSFHKNEQVQVTSIQRAWLGEERPNWSDSYRMLQFGFIVERIGILLGEEESPRGVSQ